MKRYLVQAKLATYPEGRNGPRVMEWHDMDETDDAQTALEREWGYRRRNIKARVIDNEHPSRH